jgi:hypothetical protein
MSLKKRLAKQRRDLQNDISVRFPEREHESGSQSRTYGHPNKSELPAMRAA